MSDNPAMTFISVIVPFHNSDRYIADCAEALLSQRYPKEQYEILMIDNNSTDASVEIVKRYPRIKLLFEKKQGAYAARNNGLYEAKGGIIAFTDPDCIPASDWLQEIASAMVHPDVGIVLGSFRPARDSLILSLLADYENEKNNYVFSTKDRDLYFGYTNNMAVRKAMFDELGPFVERRRGSDAIFVHHAVERHGCGAIRYVANMRVQHMEINSVWNYCQKAFVHAHARSMQNYNRIAHVRPLTNRERLAVFRRTARSQDYPRGTSALLLGLLALGLVYWGIGSICTGRSSETNGSM